PGSGIGTRPKWLVSSEISETQRVYARCVAAVEPDWIEAASTHLSKRSYSEPHWDARRGEAVGYEKVALFGLTLVERRRVGYERIEPAVARDLFIRDGLLVGALTTAGSFLQHNLELVREIREAEARQRRRDLLVSDDALAAFYAERIPSEIANVRAFEH